MLIAAAKLTLRAPWVRSLKEKRMIAQSLIARVSQKFHVSAAEVEQQDVHQTIVVGVAAVVGNPPPWATPCWTRSSASWRKPARLS